VQRHVGNRCAAHRPGVASGVRAQCLKDARRASDDACMDVMRVLFPALNAMQLSNSPPSQRFAARILCQAPGSPAFPF